MNYFILVSASGVDDVIGITFYYNPNTESYLLSITSSYPVIYKLGPAVLTGNDIEDAIAAYPENEWIVSLEFKDYSAAYLLLGKTLEKLSENKKAIDVYKKGIAAASKKGDLMPLKDMQNRMNQLLHSSP